MKQPKIQKYLHLAMNCSSGLSIRNWHLFHLAFHQGRFTTLIKTPGLLHNMRASFRLLASSPRITFFTSPRCSLCDTAKAVVQKVMTRRPFELVTINVREEGQQQWMNKYAFDTPVVCKSPDTSPMRSSSDTEPSTDSCGSNDSQC